MIACMSCMRWHSVAEVAPTTDGYKALVSVRRCKGFVSGDDAFVPLQTTAIWVQGRWITEKQGDVVTHWMPLPEEPGPAE